MGDSAILYTQWAAAAGFYYGFVQFGTCGRLSAGTDAWEDHGRDGFYLGIDGWRHP